MRALKAQQRCATPRCEGQPGHGRKGRFCEDHAEQLVRVAVELKAEARARISPDGRVRRGRKPPTCCRSGCVEPRVPPDAFCEQCQRAGYVEGAED